MIERVSEYLHELWKSWATSIVETESLSKERIKRWKEFFKPYSELDEKTKDIDRVIAKQIIEVITKEMNK